THPDHPQRKLGARFGRGLPDHRADLVGDEWRIEMDTLVVVEQLLAQNAGGVVLAELDPVRMTAELAEAQPAAAQTEQVAPRPEAQSEVDEALRGEPDPDPPERAQQPHTRWGGANPPRDLVDDLPLLAGLAARRHDRVGPLDERREREGEERGWEVVTLEERRARKDVVGVAARLGDVEVDGDHKIEFLHRVLKLGPVRHRQHRIAGGDEQGADLTGTGR